MDSKISTVRRRRPRRRVMTDADVANLRRKLKRYPEPDPELVGHWIRVMPVGAHVFTATARDPSGRQVWGTIGNTDTHTIEAARAEAREAIRRIKQGLPAREPPPPPEVKPDTVADVAATWLTRYARKNELRTADEMERILDRYILPRWATLPFVSIKRSTFARLLDEIEDAHGAYMADNVASVLRSIGTWYLDVSDDYVSPFAKVKPRVPEHKRSRDRVLEDHELQAIWKAASAPDAGAYGAMVRLALLTAQRLSVVVGLKFSDVSPDGVWTMRKDHRREKENGGKIKLPKAALDIINAQQRFVGDDDVFAGHRSFNFDRMKKALDVKCGVTGWRFHDLRRTARTLMSRAKVERGIAERVLGHAVGSKVERTYNRFDFEKEKSAALHTLAALIQTIVQPPAPEPKRKRQPKRDTNILPFNKMPAVS